MNSNKIIIGRRKKSDLIISCIVAGIFSLLMIVISISSYNEIVDPFEMVFFWLSDLIVFGLLIFIVVYQAKLPNDLIIYDKENDELIIRVGLRLRQLNKPLVIKVEELEYVKNCKSDFHHYIIVSTHKAGGIYISLKNKKSFFISNVAEGESVERALNKIILEHKESN